MTELVLKAREFSNHSLTTAAQSFGNFNVLLQSFRRAFFLEKLPDICELTGTVDALKQALDQFSYSNGYLKAAFLTALSKGHVASLQPLLDQGIELETRPTLMFSQALKAPDARCLNFLLERLTPDIKCGEFNLDTYLLGLTINDHQEKISELLYHGAKYEDPASLHTPWLPVGGPQSDTSRFSAKAHRLQVALAEENFLPNLDKICGSTGLKIRKSDAFNRPNRLYKSNFLPVALHAARLAIFLSAGDTALETKLFEQLIQADICRVENTKGLSWNKYRELENQNLNRISNFADVLDEIGDSVVLPILMLAGIDINRQPANIPKKIAAMLVIEGKSTMDFGGINESWHRAGNQLPDKFRPFREFGAWNPLFEGEIDLGQDYSICDLNTPRALKIEGDTLSHCVGRGSYGQSCVTNGTHILSIRYQGKPIATLELAPAHLGRPVSLKDGAEKAFEVRQFRAYNNTVPTKETQAAWTRFCHLVEKKEIRLTDKHGPLAGMDNTYVVSEDDRKIGYPLSQATEFIPHILAHYATRVRLQKNNGSFVPLLREIPLDSLKDRVLEAYEALGKFAQNEPAPVTIDKKQFDQQNRQEFEEHINLLLQNYQIDQGPEAPL